MGVGRLPRIAGSLCPLMTMRFGDVSSVEFIKGLLKFHFKICTKVSRGKPGKKVFQL